MKIQNPANHNLHNSPKAYFMLSIWALGIVSGLACLYQHEFTPGNEGNIADHWVESSEITRENSKYQLLIFLHPHCPCSSASLQELLTIITHTQEKLTATALFIQPPSFNEKWVKSTLWQFAETIPQVTVAIDYGGKEAEQFGATTSGHTLLYNRRGQLVFKGGITSSRGHEGSNLGANSIIEIVQGKSCQIFSTPCFGCPLFNQSNIITRQ